MQRRFKLSTRDFDQKTLKKQKRKQNTQEKKNTQLLW